MTQTDYLDEIHRRADAAHPEPWVAQHGVTHDWDEARWVEDAEGQVLATLPPVSHLDAEFIAHARTDVPRLVAALRAVEALCDDMDRHTGEAIAYDGVAITARLPVDAIRSAIRDAIGSAK